MTLRRFDPAYADKSGSKLYWRDPKTGSTIDNTHGRTTSMAPRSSSIINNTNSNHLLGSGGPRLPQRRGSAMNVYEPWMEPNWGGGGGDDDTDSGGSSDSDEKERKREAERKKRREQKEREKAERKAERDRKRREKEERRRRREEEDKEWAEEEKNKTPSSPEDDEEEDEPRTAKNNKPRTANDGSKSHHKHVFRGLDDIAASSESDDHEKDKNSNQKEPEPEPRDPTPPPSPPPPPKKQDQKNENQKPMPKPREPTTDPSKQRTGSSANDRNSNRRPKRYGEDLDRQHLRPAAAPSLLLQRSLSFDRRGAKNTSAFNRPYEIDHRVYHDRFEPVEGISSDDENDSGGGEDLSSGEDFETQLGERSRRRRTQYNEPLMVPSRHGHNVNVNGIGRNATGAALYNPRLQQKFRSRKKPKGNGSGRSPNRQQPARSSSAPRSIAAGRQNSRDSPMMTGIGGGGGRRGNNNNKNRGLTPPRSADLDSSQRMKSRNRSRNLTKGGGSAGRPKGAGGVVGAGNRNNGNGSSSKRNNGRDQAPEKWKPWTNKSNDFSRSRPLDVD